MFEVVVQRAFPKLVKKRNLPRIPISGDKLVIDDELYVVNNVTMNTDNNTTHAFVNKV